MKSIWQKQMKIPLFDTIVSPSDPLCDGCGAVAVTERISRPHARSGPYDSAGTPPAERHRRIRAHAAAGREEWRQEEAGKRYGERRIRGGPGREEIGPGRNRVGSGRAGPWRGYSSPSSKYIPSIRASISRRSFFVGRPVPRSRKTKIVSRGADSFASSSAGVMLRQ